MKNIFHRKSETLFNKGLFLFILLQGYFIGVPHAFAQPNNPPSGSGGSIRFRNPLGADSLGGFIDALLGLLVQLAVPVIALFIIYAGFLMVTARGNEGQLEKAKKTLVYTMIGAAVVLGARVISGMITGTLLSL